MKTLLTLLVSLCTVFATYAELRLPTIFADDMILQQETNASIWGFDEPNTKITVKSSWGAAASTKTDENGAWKIILATPKADYQPQTLTIAGSTKIKLNNILMGEVWLCSGQSNMSLPLTSNANQPVENSLQDIARSNNPNLRLFTVERTAVKDAPIDTTVGIWESAHPNTTGHFSAVAYYFGRQLQKILDVPIGLIHSSWGGTAIELWMSEEALSEFSYSMQKRTNLLKTDTDPKKIPCSLFNGMINSFVGYAMRGAIWYQGEANRFNTELYPSLFAAMRSDWQQRWGIGEFPIYICQVAPYDYDSDKSLAEQRNSAFLREAMFKIAKDQPNVEMAVLMDVGEKDCIHASRKRQVGERLSYIALARDYGYDGLEYKAPTYQSATFEDGRASITFDNISAGFYKSRIITSQFEVAGADRKFHPATEYEIKGDKIVVSSSDVAQPIAVRYAFKDFIDGSLFGANGLPVSSFRSDEWDDVN